MPALITQLEQPKQLVTRAPALRSICGSSFRNQMLMHQHINHVQKLRVAAQLCPISHCKGRHSVCPTTLSLPVRSSAYPLSDSEDSYRSTRCAHISAPRLSLRDCGSGGATPRSSFLHSCSIDSKSPLLKAVSIGCLDTHLPGTTVEGIRDQIQSQEECQEGPGDGIGTNQLNRSTLSLAPASTFRNLSFSRAGIRSQTVDIRQKISEWECRKEMSPRRNLMLEKRKVGDRASSEGCPSMLPSPCSEKTFDLTGFKRMSRSFSECSYPETEDDASDKESFARHERLFGKNQPSSLCSKEHPKKQTSAVLSRIQKIEQALKESPNKDLPQLPSSCYGRERLKKKSFIPSVSEDIKEPGSTTQRGSVSSVLTEPEPDPVIEKTMSKQQLSHNSESSYHKPEPPAESLPSIVVNPVPKPKRTFEYEADKNHRSSPSNNLPPSSTPTSPPPLPSTPAPPVTRRQKKDSNLHRKIHNRKSFEFEDAVSLQSSHSPSPTENGTSTSPLEVHSRFSSKSTLAEENAYEDIIGDTPKENPYEDVELKGRYPGRKLQLSSENSLDSLHRMWSPQDRKYATPPQLVRKINGIYSAKRGKKRLKKLSLSNFENASLRDENSESESDSDDRFKAHTQRLVHIQSVLKKAPSYRTLERELIEWQERELFEYFVVISLKKKPSKNTYIPEVSYQFPKLERPTKQVREAEERLKAIPQFCFPDAKDWSPVSDFISETFSFMLTGEDGSRRFGYCRRLLPSGKGPRLPEVYCVISRLGCFTLFSKILDEVERRRGISAALVYPFMRSLMESPFPAPGRTIRVKTFLPGAGNEVIELRRPMDSRLEHVDFDCLFRCLSIRQIIRIFASLLLERRVIFIADKLSTLSSCAHAVVALLYPFSWQHTFIPVLPSSMIDIVCCPTPFLVGLLSSSLSKLKELPVEEALMVDLGTDRFLRQMDDEDSLIPRKLQAALEQALEQKNELVTPDSDSESDDECNTLNNLVSEAFIRFFVETVGHYSLFLTQNERNERIFQREAFRKSVASKSIRRFLEVFMESQMFAGFIQDRELRKCRAKGLFEQRVEQYLEELPDTEQSGVNKFLKGLGNKMKFLHKKS
ncbi:suppression of tumorigenicity 5 protein [Chiloscyllium plagiosum]|uniref:suppression of tumorigenicity 5 protein n=1 Tax=Chiloscyllium plagiosum TaxID=36176 RepID=UPI001CB7CB9C|nr:suppression of tumorigenicity 5 protein [Chiloscyllium plagiosum]